MGIILIGQTGRYAADHAAVDSKPGGVNVSIRVPSMVAETARRLGRQQKKFIAIHNPAQCTETGARGTCGASVLPPVDPAKENACASVTIRLPSLEERAAWAQTDKPCLAVCLIVLSMVNGVCGLPGPRVQPRAELLNARGHASVIILQLLMAGRHARGRRNRKNTASWNPAW